MIIRINGRFPTIERDYDDAAAPVDAKWRSMGISFVDVPWSSLVPPSNLGGLSRILARLTALKTADLFRRIPFAWLGNSFLIFPDCGRFPQLLSLVKSERIDILIAPGPLCTMYAAPLKGICKVSISAEGPHVNTKVRFETWSRENRPSHLRLWVLGILNRTRCWQEARAEVAILKTYTRVLLAGQHYLRWALHAGLRGCSHIPLPLKHEAAIGEPDAARRANREKFRILMIGHLNQTSNRTQLPLLMDEILPAMDRLFRDVPWLVRIVGSHDSVEGRYAALSRHPKVCFAGPVDDAGAEFAEADVLLAPVTAETGPRTKIIQAFAHGLPVVAHINNQLGIAELVHYGNCILGQSGLDLAVGLRRLYDDPALAQRLGASGRDTYETAYRADRSCEILHNLLKDSWTEFISGSGPEWFERPYQRGALGGRSTPESGVDIPVAVEG
ncbi:MAG TPA: glycosyltransferase family 4 protein [Vicinamibacterales bacterium]|nr:glycosyltransferase family 4 protein [Vicinamibacterales bacterium]